MTPYRSLIAKFWWPKEHTFSWRFTNTMAAGHNARLGILEYKRNAQCVMNKERELWNSRFLGNESQPIQFNQVTT